MSLRTIAYLLAALAGVPLLSALALAATPSLGWAVALCIAVALTGVVGAAVGVAQIGRWADERRSPHAAEVDALARSTSGRIFERDRS